MMRSVVLIIALLVAGCASEPRGLGNRSAEATKVVKQGIIESVKPIEMDDSSSSGAFAGSIAGQAGGVSVGGGRGASVGIVLGNVLGITLGQQAGIATKPGLEIWVKLNDEDKSAYVMQPGTPEAFKAGDHVRVIYDKGETRVEALNTVETPKTQNQPR